MKKPKKPTRPATDTALPPPPSPLDEPEPLRPGDVVMLPDGALAAVEKIVGADAYVVEWQKQIGRGPWIFPVSDLAVVS